MVNFLDTSLILFDNVTCENHVHLDLFKLSTSKGDVKVFKREIFYDDHSTLKYEK